MKIHNYGDDSKEELICQEEDLNIFNKIKNDIKKIDLSNKSITLVLASDIKIDESIKAFKQCLQLCKFTKSKIFSSFNIKNKVKEINDKIDIYKIKPLKSRADYSKFILCDLNKYIDTEYILIVQYDGFIVNTNAWNNDFFRYDYIGAPCSWSPNVLSVGNGGFSLRSKKLLNEIEKNLKIFNNIYEPEDMKICKNYVNFFTRLGIKIAPMDVAEKFAWQQNYTGHKYNAQFGIHDGFKRENYKKMYIENTKDKNVILGTVVNYDFKKIKPFLETLKRTEYSGDIVLFWDKLDNNTIENIENRYKNVKLIKLSVKDSHVNNYRFYNYLEFLEKCNYINVALLDIRDVIFQKDPFDFKIDNSLYAFTEDEIIGNCNINKNWIKNTLNEKIFNKLKDNYISCAGTIIAPIDIMIKHVRNICLELDKIEFKRDILNKPGSDQAIHNFLVNTKQEYNVKFFNSWDGPVANVGVIGVINDKELNYDTKGRLINSFGIVNIIHQYDFKRGVLDYIQKILEESEKPEVSSIILPPPPIKFFKVKKPFSIKVGRSFRTYREGDEVKESDFTKSQINHFLKCNRIKII